MGEPADDLGACQVLLQLPQIQILIPLAEPSPIGGKQHGHMGVLRVGQAQQGLQIHLPGSGA